MAPNSDCPSGPLIWMRTRAPNFLKPVVAVPRSIVSIARRSAILADGLSASLTRDLPDIEKSKTRSCLGDPATTH